MKENENPEMFEGFLYIYIYIYIYFFFFMGMKTLRCLRAFFFMGRAGLNLGIMFLS